MELTFGSAGIKRKKKAGLATWSALDVTERMSLYEPSELPKSRAHKSNLTGSVRNIEEKDFCVIKKKWMTCFCVEIKYTVHLFSVYDQDKASAPQPSLPLLQKAAFFLHWFLLRFETFGTLRTCLKKINLDESRTNWNFSMHVRAKSSKGVLIVIGLYTHLTKVKTWGVDLRRPAVIRQFHTKGSYDIQCNSKTSSVILLLCSSALNFTLAKLTVIKKKKEIRICLFI